MSAIPRRSVVSARRILAGAAGRAIRGMIHFVRLMKNRRVAARLAGLDDRMLADIGITRSDLRDAYAQPLWHDPTDVLAWRASERRGHRRRSARRPNDNPGAASALCGSNTVCGGVA